MLKMMAQHLSDVIRKAENRVSAGDKPCLNRLSFGAFNQNSLSNELGQNLFDLCWYPSHLARFYLCYHAIANVENVPANFRIISIADGLGFDYLALPLAFRQTEKTWSYLGTDPLQYHERPVDERISYKMADCSQVDSEWLCDKNVIMFPHTLVSANQYQMTALKAVFAQASFASSHLIVINSSSRSTIGRFDRIIELFRDKGYRIRAQCTLDHFDGLRFNTILKEKGRVSWDYPPELMNRLMALKTRCRDAGFCGDCCEWTGFLPHMTYRTDCMQDTIVYFDR